MKVTKVRYGETVPNPQVAYASLRPEFEIEIEEGEDPIEAVKKAKELCHEAMTAALGADDQRNDAIKSLNQIRREITRWEEQGAKIRVKTKEQAQLFEDIVKKMYPDQETTNDEADDDD